MSAELLLREFERLSEAPDAIPRLRRFVLDLAVSGKLVEQNPDDRPAEELLRMLGSAIDDAGSGPLHYWVRARLGDIIDFKYGKSLPAGDRLESGPVRVFGSNGVVGYCRLALSEQPAIIVGRKGSAGALNVSEGPSWTTDVAYFVVPPSFLDLRFLVIALQTLDLDQLGKGVKPGLSRDDAYGLDLLVPPLQEQNRIVGKVDDLIALCDRLAAAQTERERRRRALAAISIQRLADAESSEGEPNAEFWLEHSHHFITKPEDVAKQRRLVLDLAVFGRLTTPRAARGSARTVGDTSTRPLPAGWHWKRLDEICNTITDGDHLPPPKSASGVAFLTIGNVSSGRLDFDGCRFVPQEYFDAIAEYRRPATGDILYTVVGATYGRALLVESDRPFCVQRHIAILKPSSAVDRRFLLRVLNSSFVYEQATRGLTGTAQPTLPLRALRALTVPVPPLEEQWRVIAKIDKLMAVSDGLEKTLELGENATSMLLDASLREALATV